MKGSSKRKLSGLVIKGFVFVTILGIGFALAYVTDSGRGIDYDKSFEVVDMSHEQDMKELEYVFSTPWPPTEAQSACNEKLEDDRKNPELSQLIGAAYCGATGEYVGYASSGNFIINRDLLLNRLSSDQNSYSGQNCTTESIPFSTVREYVSTLLEGTQYTLRGIEGSKIYCDNKLVHYLPPYNAKVVVGTAKPFTPSINVPSAPDYGLPSGPTYTYNEAFSMAQNNCSVQIGSNSSAYWVCIDILMEDYGYPEYVPQFN